MTDLADIAQQVVGLARPGEQVEAFVSRSRRLTVRAWNGEVESLTQAEPMGIGVRVIVDGRQGFAHAGTLEATVIGDVLAEARDNLAFTEPDPWVGLAEPDGVAPPTGLVLHHPSLAVAPTADKVRLALELERATVAADPRMSVRSAVYGDTIAEVAVASTTGIAVASQATACWLTVSALATDGGETQTGVGVGVGRDLSELDPATVAADAVDRATRLLGARPITSRRLTVVLDPRVAASFLGIVAGTLTGDRVLKGRSPFRDRVGERIASARLTLVDDPTDVRSFGADTHDGEGIATRRNVLIDGGVLRSFLHDAYTGRRSGQGTTGNAVRGYASTPSVGVLALQPVPGLRPLADLVAGVDDGLLVQSVTGLHSGVNPVSGDFSVGAEGLRIVDGELAEPVREVTIASTLQRMLLDLEEVGGDVEWLPSGDCGVSLVISDVSLSGR